MIKEVVTGAFLLTAPNVATLDIGSWAERSAAPITAAPAAEFRVASSWRATQDGNDWYVRKGKNTFIKMPDEKTAKKTAKKMNKAEKKDKKEENDSVRAEPGAPCNDPMSGVVC